ncbi:MAG: hypothetical protein FWC20_02935 [Oscillospiraceae bacterium]|nr:hypothetical protein [Oscillospiraceae bacterium]MCL2278346.1 hypothetical protein [Oscillospiraceae bacterium]
MTDLQFKSVLQLNTPLIIKEITKTLNITQKEAIELFYGSNLYEKYTEENTKLWHYSPVVMADLLSQELENGEIEYPS